MFRSLAKRVYYSGVKTLASSARLRSIKEKDEVVILNLHRVSPRLNPFWPELHPEVFRGLLTYLQLNFTVCRLSELKEIKSDRPFAVLSFDDGYYDFVEFAVPILKEFGMPANMNVIPSCVVSGRPIWNVQLYDFLSSSPKDRINALEIQGFDKKLDDESSRAKLLFGMSLAGFLKRRPRSERIEIWRSIEKLIAGSIEQTRMMNAEEIRLLGDMVDFGVHSYSHESMGYESNDFFTEDLDKCRDFFAEVLNLPLEIYAFPNGSYRDEQVEHLRDHGLQHILLVDEAFSSVRNVVHPRLTIYGETANEAAMRALGF